jgi:hypothetical protein
MTLESETSEDSEVAVVVVDTEASEVMDKLEELLLLLNRHELVIMIHIKWKVLKEFCMKID